MSANELIDQLKALSAKERKAFARLFRELENPTNTTVGNGNTASGSSKWPDFGVRLERIYGSKVVADSKAVISYARGDS